jgi:hypothetical protein
MHSLGKKLTCWSMSTVLLFTWCVLPFAQEPTPQASARKQTAERLGKLFQALESVDEALPRDSFEPQAVVDSAGSDPDKLFEWVRGQTSWVPYRGVLRGARGVLMDRLGNSLDRSLLLAELLRLAGHEARLAHATLPEASAQELLTKLRQPAKEGQQARTPTASKPDEILDRVAQEQELDKAELKSVTQEMEAERQRLVQEAGQRVDDQTKVLAAALGQAAPAEGGPALAADLAALRDHWWVQCQKESEEWTDLDLLAPDAAAGKRLAEPEQTVAPDQLDAELFHSIGLRVVVEFTTGDAVQEETVLTQDLRPSELVGGKILLTHRPVNWTLDPKSLTGADAADRLKAAVLAQHEWQPVLSVGSEEHMQSSFTDTGKVGQPSEGEPAGQMGGALGGLLGGSAGEEQGTPAPERPLTAEWIEYEIRVPGEPAQTIRRALFDWLGPAARAAKQGLKPSVTDAMRLEQGLTLLGTTEILPTVCRLSPLFLEHLTARSMLANRDLLLGLFQGEDTEKPPALSDRLEDFTALPGPVYSLEAARWAWSRSGDDLYLDRPNVLSYHTRIRPEGPNELVLCQGFDIVSNSVAVRPGSGKDGRSLRLEQGVLDTNAEALLTPDCGKLENAAEILAAARKQGVGWTLIRSAADSAWQSLALPADVRARIQQDLAAGNVVLVPSKAAETGIGWWRIDPKTGQTLGIGARGWGQSTTEQVVLASRIGVRVLLALMCLRGAERSSQSQAAKGGLIVLCVLSNGVSMGGVMSGVGAISLVGDIFGAIGTALGQGIIQMQ